MTHAKPSGTLWLIALLVGTVTAGCSGTDGTVASGPTTAFGDQPTELPAETDSSQESPQ